MKFLKFGFIILLVLYFLFTLIAPPIVDADKNNTTYKEAYPAAVSEQAKTLVNEMEFIGDLHCDALLWNRKLYKQYDYGHVDFPRMREGNVAFQAFTIVTKSPAGQNFQENSSESFDMITALSIGQGQSPTTWFSLMNRALYQCKKLHRHSKKDKKGVIVVKSKSDLTQLITERQAGKETLGGMLGVEGGHCLEGKLENLSKLYEAGVRMLGPTHFFDNEMGGSAHGEERKGLTDFGRSVMQEMEQRNMIMDLAHSSETIVDEVLAAYNGPILTSHTGVDGTYPSSRNLSDKHLLGIAEKEGLIGIAYFPGAIGSNGLSGIVKAMVYVKALIGVEHLALGSDFDGSVTTPFDVRGMPMLADEMLKAGFTEAEIRAVFGENLQRFLMKWLP